jgi:hypothetical protein
MLCAPSVGFGLPLGQLPAFEALDDGVALPFTAGDLVVIRIDVDRLTH